METRITGRTSTWRTRLGESVLSTARAIDASPVKARLDDFERAHHDYAEAHQAVLTAEAQVETAEARLAACDAVQDKAINTLAGVLIAGGQPHEDAFGVFGAPTVRELMRLPVKEKAQAVHQLAAVLQRNDSLGQATAKAAKAADKAARGAEQALVPLDKMWQALRHARDGRDAKTVAWDKAIACLKLDARTVARGGTPEIYKALFSRSGTKSTKAAANSPPVTETPAAPTPPPTDASQAA